MNVQNASGINTDGLPWAILPGMALGIDTGNKYEVVSVKSVSGNSFVADFANMTAVIR